MTIIRIRCERAQGMLATRSVVRSAEPQLRERRKAASRSKLISHELADPIGMQLAAGQRVVPIWIARVRERSETFVRLKSRFRIGICIHVDGAQTIESQLRLFYRQRTSTQHIVPDGIVGPKTWAALDAAPL